MTHLQRAQADRTLSLSIRYNRNWLPRCLGANEIDERDG